MNVRMVPARLEDAFVLSTTLRPEDVRELAACGQGPLEGLLLALKCSREAGTLLYDDIIGAMYGVTAAGQLWFLTGHLFGEKPIAFLRVARVALKGLLGRYTALSNVIDSRYTGALKLAAAMGATFGSPRDIGGVPFIPFTLRRH
jgi:hypothetical protein